MRVARRIAAVLVPVILSNAWSIAAASPKCNVTDAALEAGFKSWPELHAAFSPFKGCDDGAIAEGYSDAVVVLLAKHWSDLGVLQKLSKADPAFLSFVLKHIDATTDPNDVARIMASCRKRCPPTATSLCKDIEAASNGAKAMFEGDGSWTASPLSDDCRAKIPADLAVALDETFPHEQLPLIGDNLTNDVAANRRDGGSGCLGIASGDFDHDGSTDLALLLGIGPLKTRLVSARHRGAHWHLETLRTWEGSQRFALYVDSLRAGAYRQSPSLDGSVTEPGEVDRILTKSGGIVSGQVESSGVAYFLDGNQWNHVWISD